MPIFGSKRRIPINKDDIKKAIKNANDRLKKANNKLDKDISAKKELLISINKDIKAYEQSIKSYNEEIELAKIDTVTAKEEAKKERAKLSKIKSQFTKSFQDKTIVDTELNNLTKESKALNKKVAKMNDDLSIVSSLKGELKILKADKKKEQDELKNIKSEANDIKKELSKLRSESIAKKETHKELLDKLDAEAKIKQKSLDTVDIEYEKKMFSINAKLGSLEDALKEKEQESNVMDSLIKKRELDYIDIESRYKQAENALIFTKDITNKEIEREKEEVNKIKDQFKQWKLSALEEVAKLKLKNKIENIDKAGLSEILNG